MPVGSNLGASPDGDRATRPSDHAPAGRGDTASVPSAGHVLCYVEGAFAYFTNKPLARQWGDDWDDAPFEHNAGAPYSDLPGQIAKVAWEGPFDTPDDGQLNSPYSVMDINQGDVPWLRLSRWSRPKRGASHIPAGVTLLEFVRRIQAAGGEVYLPASAGPQ